MVAGTMSEPLTEQEYARAWAVSKDYPLWRALMQFLDAKRDDAIDATRSHVIGNNALGLAATSGTIETIERLKEDLEDMRAAATQD